MQRQIYLDNAATTRVDPRVLEEMLPWLGDRYGNPASRTHAFGWESEEGVEHARSQIASVLGAKPTSLFFTSGATESDNLALRGVLGAYRSKGRHFVISTIEHSAIRESARALVEEGWECSLVPVDASGRVRPEQLAPLLREDTVLASVVHANNEIGVLQDLEAIGALCRSRGVLFHTDAAQSFGKVPIDVELMKIDLLSASAHKIHGPKGVGVLYVRRLGPRVRIEPLVHGGGHEGGLRAGTLNVPAIVGFGKAAEIARDEMPIEAIRIASLRDRLESVLLTRLRGVRRNGGDPRVPGISNVHFEGVDGEAVLLGARDVAFSSGSACASATLEPSHVLLALGQSPREARNALRFSLGRFTTAEEIEAVLAELIEVIEVIERVRPSTQSEAERL